MKTKLSSVLFAMAICLISCTTEGINQREVVKKSNPNLEVTQKQKPVDTIGGQGGTIPPPPPPFK